MDKFDFLLWVGSSWGWIMEFKPCHSCEDLAQDRVVIIFLVFCFLRDSAIVWTVPFSDFSSL